jgi:hypothetical protein
MQTGSMTNAGIEIQRLRNHQAGIAEADGATVIPLNGYPFACAALTAIPIAAVIGRGAAGY